MRAIETHYDGYRFRSRLEARWAVVFNRLNIPYEYEPEGFYLPDGSMYLPDFYLPSHRVFAEVKGGPISSSDWAKVVSFATARNLERDRYDAVEVVLLGSLHPEKPQGNDYSFGSAYPLPTHIGVLAGGFWYGRGVSGGSYERFSDITRVSVNLTAPTQPLVEFGLHYTEQPTLMLDVLYNPPRLNHLWSNLRGPWYDTVEDIAARKRILSAYAAGRHARFEHGENPDA